MERISLSAVMAALQIVILFGTEKNADLIFCLLNCLWSENTFLTADFGKTQSCWLLGDSILPSSSSSCHLWLILGTNLFPSAFQASFLICFFLKHFLFFQRNSDHFPCGEMGCFTFGKVIVKGCIEPLLPFKNWHPPSPPVIHTHT